ncbi:MAG: CYTH domain-containing protein [Gammaproteobacteria bacterium]
MATEIERKFLTCGDEWRHTAHKVARMRQGYLSNNANASVRVRISGDKAQLNIKSMTLGVQRHEFEYDIPLDDAQTLLDEMADGPLVEKDRYYVRHGDHLWEVDEFFGDNAGLIVAEVELSHVDEKPQLPDWVGEDVSHEERYYNVMLAKHPFKDW